MRGRLETEDTEDRSLLVVGDRVQLRPSEHGDGVIERILARGKVLVRADKRVKRFRHVIAANVDKVILISSVREPRFRPGIVDRFLVAASSQEMPAALVINKTDLADTDALREELQVYREAYGALGLDVVLTSAQNEEGLAALEALLRDSRAVLVGHSGVGKSSLLNALSPSLRLAARAVNRKTLKGTHTTSVAQILRLPSGVEVIDTPGLRELEIIDVSAVDLEAHFPEFLPLLPDCEKDNCAHVAEPGCAIKRAVEEGAISERRYQSYLDIRSELEKADKRHDR